MPDPNLIFDPVTGWEDETVFVKSPATEAITRSLFQRLFTQIQTHMNTTLVTWINSTFATQAALTGVALGSVPDDSISDAKLATDNKIGSNATLTTTHKTTLVGAINELVASVASVISNYATKDEDIGKIEYFAMQTPPTRRLEANGAAVSRTTYAKLFAAIGTTYGVGDGSTTFNLPDMRGVFPRGWDNGKGYDTGRSFGSYQADENKAHTHTGTTGTESATHTHTVTGSNSSQLAGGGTSGSVVFASGSFTSSAESATHTHAFTTSSNGNTEVTVKNVALLACIKH